VSRGASIRLFAALDPPAEVGEELLRWARAALRESGERSARLLALDSLHVTLMFLGERPGEEVDALAHALSEAAARSGPCELRTGAPVWLPPRHPRALAVEVHDLDGRLDELQREVASSLCEVCGMQRPRRFRAHLTVARARSAESAGIPLAPTPALDFSAGEVVLYRSHLDPAGARYERLAVAELRT
jgi:RNA 2',3'-cyclic 3'-phosphodiesterase